MQKLSRTLLGTPPSESLDPPITEIGEPDSLNQTQEPDPPNPPEEACALREETPLVPPLPPSPLPTRPDDALLALGLDDVTQTQLYDQAKATMVAEGVSPWHLILPHIQCRMLALWGAQALPRGEALDPQPGETRAGGWPQGSAA